MAYYLLTFIILAAVLFLLYTINKIKVARHRGKNLPKKNFYYAMVAKMFMRDLPD